MPAPKTLIIRSLLAVNAAYCAATGESRASVAKQVFGRGGHFKPLEEGARDLGTVALTRVAGWYDRRWPENAEWPKEAAWLRHFAQADPLAAQTEAAE